MGINTLKAQLAAAQAAHDGLAAELKKFSTYDTYQNRYNLNVIDEWKLNLSTSYQSTGGWNSLSYSNIIDRPGPFGNPDQGLVSYETRTYDNINSGFSSFSLPYNFGAITPSRRANLWNLGIGIDYAAGYKPSVFSLAYTGDPTSAAYKAQRTTTTDPGTPVVSAVSSLANTGILGISVCTGFFDLSSSTLGDVWILQTDGQIFIPGLTGGVVGAPVYYDATGAITLTAASNIKFGFIGYTDGTGTLVNITGFPL